MYILIAMSHAENVKCSNHHLLKLCVHRCENDEAQAVDLLKSFESSDETTEAPPHAASKGASSSRPSSHSTSHTRTSSASKKNASHVLQPEDAASSKATSPRRQPAKEATPKLSHAEKAKCE